MTAAWLEDLESEAFDDSEGDYDSEADYDSEETSADRVRRARARRIALARRRMAAAQYGRPTRAVAPTASPKQTVAAIRSLDLETKVGEDSLRRAVERANRRASRATYATIASVAVDQAFDSFEGDFGGHDFLRAGLRFAPLLLLSPERKRAGFEGFVLDPRVIGGAAVVGIVAADKFRNRGAAFASVEISPRNISQIAGAGKFTAIVRDKSGGTASNATVTFKSLDTSRLEVNELTGDFTPRAPGNVDVQVTAGEFRDFVSVVIDNSGAAAAFGSVAISPRSITKSTGGAFTAIVRDKNGATVSDAKVAFKSLDTSKLGVDEAGNYTATATTGAVDVQVTAGNFTDFISVQIT